MTQKGLFQTIGACRQFFAENGFLETPTPPLVEHPGMETHLHPFQVKSVYKNELLPLYLHTSPEFEMKSLLSQGFENIYHLGYCFRDEPSSHTHRPQFLMLEWYRNGAYYHEILKDTLSLINYVHHQLKSVGLPVYENLETLKFTVVELFEEYIGFQAIDYETPLAFAQKIHHEYPELLSTVDKDNLWPWEDYFFLLFLNKIESTFKKGTIVVVDEFPAPLAALSTLKSDNPKVCERFEVYLSGIELCNCFNELTNLDEQRARFKEEASKKKNLYGYHLGEPQRLYESLERGLPKSAGNALGVERLYMGLLREEVNPFYR